MTQLLLALALGAAITALFSALWALIKNRSDAGGDPVGDSSISVRRVPSMVSSGDEKLYRLADQPNQCAVGLITGDILEVTKVDIWVNGENTDMAMARVTEDSISAIVRYWGARRDNVGKVVADVIADDLARAVGSVRPVAPGSTFVTTSGELNNSNNVKYLIHVAAVHGEPGAGFSRVRNIGLCVTNALVAADHIARDDPAATTILFPLLGTGMGGAEVESTVQSLTNAAIQYLDAKPDTALGAIYFLAYNDVELEALAKAFQKISRLVPAQDLKSTDARTA